MKTDLRYESMHPDANEGTSPRPLGARRSPTPPILAALVATSLLAAPAAHAASRVFFDGFESGNTTLWQQADTRNRCQVVATSADGGPGPRSGARMVRCNWDGTRVWNDPAAFETLMLNVAYTNEVFFRVWLRIDRNLEKSTTSPAKIVRLFAQAPVYTDMFESVIRGTGNGLSNQGIIGSTSLQTYWGGLDSAGDPSAWHRVEYYFNQATNRIRVWHDGRLVRDDQIPFAGVRWSNFYIVSNWSDAHDATNYVYFDDVEVFADSGSDATGLMSEATVAVPGAESPATASIAPPTNVRPGP